MNDLSLSLFQIFYHRLLALVYLLYLSTILIISTADVFARFSSFIAWAYLSHQSSISSVFKWCMRKLFSLSLLDKYGKLQAALSLIKMGSLLSRLSKLNQIKL